MCAGAEENPSHQHDNDDAIAAHLITFLGIRAKRARELLAECGADAVNQAVLELRYGPGINSPPAFFTARARLFAQPPADDLPAVNHDHLANADDPMDQEEIAEWDEWTPKEQLEKVKWIRDYNRRYGPMYVGTPMGEKYGPREGDTLRTVNQGIPMKYRHL